MASMYLCMLLHWVYLQMASMYQIDHLYAYALWMILRHVSGGQAI